jgi:hypothetical protein
LRLPHAASQLQADEIAAKAARNNVKQAFFRSLFSPR